MNEKEFIEEIKKLGIEINQRQLQQLELYYQILTEENKKVNLTRIIEKKDVYLKHFYDSLTLVKAIDLNQENSLCDVGTGAGFPGIILKILFPNLEVTLLDALQKRVNFLNLVIQKLDLKKIETIHTRSEHFAKIKKEKYDIVTARAVANLNKLSEICMPLVKKGGYFLPMKGNIQEELQEAEKTIRKENGKVEKILEFMLPIEESKRTIIKIKKEH